MLRLRRISAYLFATLAALLLVCMAMAKPVDPHPYFSDGRFQVIAHRGGRGLMPENTLAAFQYVDSLGVDVLEMDIHASADGHLVVIHDDSVGRTTNGSGKVDALTLDQLQSLDAAYNWKGPDGSFPHRGSGVRIPHLEEVLQRFSHRRMLIEIKPNSAQVAQQLCNTLTRFSMDEKTVVASFHSDALEAFSRACPQTPVSATSSQVGLYSLLHLLRLDGAYLNPPIAFQVPERIGSLRLVDERFVASVHERAAQVHVWTVNKPDAMRRLIEVGVDGIITDYPDRLLSILNRTPEHSTP